MKPYKLKDPEAFKRKPEQPDFVELIRQEIKGSTVAFVDNALNEVREKAKNGELLCCGAGNARQAGI